MKKILIVTTTIITAIIMTACGYKLKTDPDELVVVQAADPVTFDIQLTNDSATTRVALQVYESLMKSENDLEIKPSLAKSYKKIDDKTYEFELKDNVKFHNGEKFTSKDVKWSIERAKTHEKSAVGHIVGAIDKVETDGDYKVKITTTDPFGPLLKHLAHPATAIMNEKAVSDAGADYGTKVVVGTGAYKFKEWVTGSHIKLERNEDYHDTKAKLGKITFKVMKEPTTALIELEKGNVDIVYDIQPKNRGQVEKNKNLTLIATDNLGVEYLGFNFKNENLKDKNVRKAITHLVDVPSIIKNVYSNVGNRLTGPLNSLIDAYNSDLKAYDYNEATAIEYMKKVKNEDGSQKYADGKGNFTLKLYAPTNSPERISVANIVKEELKKIGITVNVVQQDWATYIASTSKGDHDIFLLGWTTVTADADYGLYALFHSSQHGTPGNRTFYANTALDTLLDDAKKETDHDKRMTKYKEAQKIIHEELPWVFLQTRQNTTGLSKKVIGFEHHPMGSYVLKGVSKEK